MSKKKCNKNLLVFSFALLFFAHSSLAQQVAPCSMWVDSEQSFLVDLCHIDAFLDNPLLANLCQQSVELDFLPSLSDEISETFSQVTMLRDAEKARLADPLQVTVGFSTFYIKPRVSYLWKDQAYDAKHDHFITFACTPKTKRLTVTGLRITQPAGKKTKNNVTFTLPASISVLQQLSVLHLDGWRLIELPDLSPLTKLAHLSLQSNLFYTAPAPIFSLSQLRVLDLSRNPIQEVDNYAAHFDHLKVLGLIDTGIEINDHNFMQYEDFFSPETEVYAAKGKKMHLPDQSKNIEPYVKIQTLYLTPMLANP